MDDLCVHYGCHHVAPTTWLNFDASPTLRFERLPLIGRLYTRNAARFPANVRYGDIVKGLPVARGGASAVYCSHVLEHLALNDFRRALANTRAMLRPGGVFRLVMPDLEHCARAYLANPADDAAVTFINDTMLGIEERPRSLKQIAVAALGNSNHLWLWDFKAAKRELAAAGFRHIRRAQFADSTDPRFAAVEDRDRWTDNLGVECSA